MAGLLDPPFELARQVTIEEQHGLADGQPILHPAEAQHIDAGAPGEIGRRAPEERHGIGKACPVHVHLQAVAARHIDERGDLVQAVDGTELGCLSDRQCTRLDVVHAAALPRQRVDHVGRQLCERRAGRDDLRPAGEQRRRPGLVLLDVARGVGDDGVIGLADLRQRQGVCRRAVEDEEHLAIGLEQLTQPGASLLRPGIVAVAGDMTLGVGADQRIQRLRAEPRIVVGGELLGHASLRGCQTLRV